VPARDPEFSHRHARSAARFIARAIRDDPTGDLQRAVDLICCQIRWQPFPAGLLFGRGAHERLRPARNVGVLRHRNPIRPTRPRQARAATVPLRHRRSERGDFRRIMRAFHITTRICCEGGRRPSGQRVHARDGNGPRPDLPGSAIRYVHPPVTAGMESLEGSPGVGNCRRHSPSVEERTSLDGSDSPARSSPTTVVTDCAERACASAGWTLRSGARSGLRTTRHLPGRGSVRVDFAA
jgi:hypothetical protein